MEYCKGGELFQVLSNWGRLQENEAIPMFRQMLSALYYCQMINIAHRDLKPENILLGDNNTIKVADFGLCALSPKHRFLDSACGSPHYAAPELMAGEKYNPHISDVWSLGVVLYVMLSARSPFGSTNNMSELMSKVKHGRYHLKPHFSPMVKDLLTKMMQPNPELRIKLKDIWNHPLVRKYAPRDGLPGRPLDIISGPVSMWDVEVPLIKSADEVDAETMRNMLTLHPEYTEEDVIHQLTSAS
jgi:serine/threonine-protein kinase HSL1 (negative regulator of Swe1 kinase)